MEVKKPGTSILLGGDFLLSASVGYANKDAELTSNLLSHYLLLIHGGKDNFMNIGLWSFKQFANSLVPIFLAKIFKNVSHLLNSDCKTQ